MVKTIHDINIELNNDKELFIKQSDNNYINNLHKIADKIAKNRADSPIILISGPSGSGKTTTALTIEKYLDEAGFETHSISLDNYFLPISDTDRLLLEKGKLDLESPKRVDVDLLNTQLTQMINCEEVRLPRYDFTTSNRVDSGITLKRKPNELVVLEGIHSLNPEVIELPDENTVKMYVSVRTRLKYGNITLHPAYIRLMRRMMRDSIFRGRTPQETIKMFKSVEDGEEKFIMPFKYRSDIDVDTFIPYELSVYKPFLLDKLKEVELTDNIDNMIKMLQAFDPVDDKLVPRNSLIREFIGNSEHIY